MLYTVHILCELLVVLEGSSVSLVRLKKLLQTFIFHERHLQHPTVLIRYEMTASAPAVLYNSGLQVSSHETVLLELHVWSNRAGHPPHDIAVH